MEISTPVMRAPVIRWSAMGCPPSSQTQIVSATPISLALASAASSTIRASSSVSRLTVIIRAAARSRHLHPYVVAVDPHWVCRDRRAPLGHEALSGAHVVEPPVPGTGQPRPRELALAERTALVRARVGAGVHALPDSGQHDARSIDLDELAAARRHVRQHGGGPRLALLGHIWDHIRGHISSLRTNAR